MVKNPNWQEAMEADQLNVDYIQSVSEDLYSGRPRTNPASSGGGLDPGNSGLQHQRPKSLGRAV